VGIAIATAWRGRSGTAAFAPTAVEIVLLVTAMVAMYAAGMMLNDWFDLDVDRAERPRRPLPSGRIAPAAALNASIALLGVGAILSCAVNAAALPWVLLLGAVIVAYDRVHAQAWLGIPLMSSCRMLAIAVPALALSDRRDLPWPMLAWFALPLGVYIALMSVIARREVVVPAPGASAPSSGSAAARSSAHMARPGESRSGHPPRRRWAGIALFIPALAPLGVLATGWVSRPSEAALLGLAWLAGALIAWLVRAQLFATPLPAAMVAPLLPRRLRPGGIRMPRAVMAWIAAICLTDAMSLVVLGQPLFAFAALACFFVATVSHARIAGS